MPRSAPKPSGLEALVRRNNVLLEGVSSKFKSFGEGLEDVRGRLAAVEAELREVKENTDWNKLLMPRLRDDVASLTTMGRKTTADIAAIRDDIKALKADVKDRLSLVEAK